MEKDKELLLSMQPSDSDDVVEEFKLPPPRTRRPKARKAIGEARIAASNSSLLSWKCCFLFVITAIFISGALVLSYFMLSMQQQISRLTLQMSKANVDIQRHDSAKFSLKKLMSKLEQNKQKFSKQDLNIKLLVHQINQLNKTMKKLTATKEREHQLSTLTSDVDSIKTGMASTGGDIAKLQAQVLQHSDKFDSVLTELKNVKMEILKSTVNDEKVLSSVKPISAETEEIHKLKVMIRDVNKTHTRNTQRLATQIYNNNVENNEQIKDVRVVIDSVNVTLTEGLSSLFHYKITNQRIMADLQKEVKNYNTLINNTQEDVHRLQTRVDKHHLKINFGKSVDLENEVKKCKTLINSTQEEMHLWVEFVSNLEKDVKNSKALLNSTQQDVHLLQTEVDKHSKQMEETAEEINNLTSTVHNAKTPHLVPVSKEITRRPTSRVPEETTRTNSAAPVETTGKPLVTTSADTITQQDYVVRVVEEITEAMPTSTTSMPSLQQTTGKPGTRLCERAQSNANRLPGSFVPQCKGDGGYEEKQCHASTGYCWCVEPTSGNEIKGSRKGPSEGEVNCGTRLCERAQSNAKILPGSFVPQCKGDGGYEEKQCHASTGYCWCVEPTSGNEIKGSRKGPGEGEVNCDECPLKCPPDERCMKTRKGYNCVCMKGYARKGKFCEDVNECSGDDTGCHGNATCTNVFGSYLCTCNQGFQGNGTHCQLIQNGSSPLEVNTSIATNVTNGVRLFSTNSSTANSTMKPLLANSSRNGTANISQAEFLSKLLPITESLHSTEKEKHMSTDIPGEDLTSDVPYLTPEMPDESGRYPEPDATLTEKQTEELPRTS